MESPLNHCVQRIRETPESEASKSYQYEKRPEESTTEMNAIIPLQLTVSSTPILLRKVNTPKNLELDFEPSSAAEWSFSMATPTDRLTVQETPVSVANSTSTEEEEEYECPTTNESVLELRKVLHGGSAKANRKLPLRKILANGNKPVVRTLFPANSSLLSNSKSSLTISPLVQHHMTPAYFGSPNLKNSEEAFIQEDTSCNQKLFDNSESFIQDEVKGIDNSDMNDRGQLDGQIESIPASPPMTIEQSPLFRDTGGGNIESLDLVGKSPLIPSHNSTPLSSQIPQNVNLTSTVPVNYPSEIPVHSTPLPPPVPIKLSDLTTVTPFEIANEPSPDQQELSTPSITPVMSVVAATPGGNSGTKPLGSATGGNDGSKTLEFTFRDGEDVLEMLFMSSSQLEDHISLHQNDSENKTVTAKVCQSLTCSETGVVKAAESPICIVTGAMEKYTESPACNISAVTGSLACDGIDAEKFAKERGYKEISTPGLEKRPTKPFSYPSLKKLGSRVNKTSRIRMREVNTGVTICDGSLIKQKGGKFDEPQAKRKRIDASQNECSNELSTTERCRQSDNQDPKGSGCDEGGGDNISGSEHLREVNSEMNEECGMDSEEICDDIREVVEDSLCECEASKHSEQAAMVCLEQMNQNSDLSLKSRRVLNSVPSPAQASLMKKNDIRDSEHSDTLSMTKTSPIQVKRPSRAPGLRRSVRKQLTKHTREEVTNSTTTIIMPPVLSVNQDEPIHDLLGGNGDLSNEALFKTAAGSSILISARALERARNSIGDEEEKDPLFSVPKSSGQRVVQDISSNSVNSLSCIDDSTHSCRTPFEKPTVSRSSFHPVTLPRTKPPARKRQLAKGFKAPRRACSVPDDEERASIARILKNFGVSGIKSSNQKASVKQDTIESKFATASGRKLTVSHSAMLKDQKVLEEDKENLGENGILNDVVTASEVVSSDKETWKHSDEDVAESDLLLPKVHSMFGPDAPLKDFGFKTASGKGIPVSAVALERAQEIMDSCEEEAGHIANVGFKTAGGKGIPVSAKALERAQEIMDSCGEEAGHIVNVDSIIGFKTAGGKGIPVSAKALEKVQEIMDSCGEEAGHIANVDSITGFKTAGGKGIPVSAKALERAQEIMDSCEEEEGVNVDSITGFKTADGKEMYKPLGRILDTCEEERCRTTITAPVSNTAAGGKEISVSVKKAQEIVESEEERRSVQDANFFSTTGFKTAGGREISVSANALKKAQEIMKGEEERHSVKDSATGFKTAGGREISVSADALKKAEKILLTEEKESETCDRMEFAPCTSPADRNKLVIVDPFISSSPVNLNRNSNVPSMDYYTESPLKLSRGDDNEDSGSCYFSTQIVRQLLNFSSEDESAAEDNACSDHASLALGSPCLDLPKNHPTDHNVPFELEPTELEGDEHAAGGDDPLPTGEICLELQESHKDIFSESMVDIACFEESATSCMETSHPSPPLLDTSCDISKVVLLATSEKNSEEGNLPSSPQNTSFKNKCSPVSSASLPKQSSCPSSQVPSPPSPQKSTCSNLNSTPLQLNLTNQSSSSSYSHGNFSLVSPESFHTNSNSSPSPKSFPSAPHSKSSQTESNSPPSPPSPKDFSSASCSMISPENFQMESNSPPSFLAPHNTSSKSLPVSPRNDSTGSRSLHSLPASFEGSLHHFAYSSKSWSTLSDTSTHVHTTPNLQASHVQVNSRPFPTCFMTAGGRKVDVSSEALRAVMSKHEISCSVDFSSSEVPSESCMETVEEPLEPDLGSEVLALLSPSQIEKQVGLDDKQIPVAREVDQDTTDIWISSGSFPNLETANEKESGNKESSRVSKATDSGSNLYSALMTASGNEVTMKDDAIRAEKIALGGANTVPKLNQPQHPKFPGLQTASGKEVIILEDSIRAAKRALGDSSAVPELHQASKFPALQTASGKEVVIQEESIATAKKALGDAGVVPELHQSDSKCPGLLTASGKEVIVKEVSCSAAKMTLSTQEPSKFPGLQTASGKEVSVREESIRAAKMALEETGSHQHTTKFPGLQTASGKEVTVQEKSIKAAKMALGESTAPNSWPHKNSLYGPPTKQVRLSEDFPKPARTTTGLMRFNEGPGKGSASSSRTRSSTVGALPIQQRQPSNRSLRSIPEGTLCDRTAVGERRLLPVQSYSVGSRNSRSSVGFSSLHHPSSSPLPHHDHNHIKFQKQSLHVFESLQRKAPHNRQARNRSFSYNNYNSSYRPSTGLFTTKPTYSQSHDYSNAYHNTSSSSYATSTETNFAAAMKGRPMNLHGNCLPPPVWKNAIGNQRTSTQVDEGVASRRPVPSSCDPLLHITLSQICEMEESQTQGDFGVIDSSLGECVRNKRVTDDSGYLSREASTLRSPSPLQLEQKDTGTTSGINEDITDLLFAEVAMEGLDDTLEEAQSEEGSLNKNTILETNVEASKSDNLSDVIGAIESPDVVQNLSDRDSAKSEAHSSSRIPNMSSPSTNSEVQNKFDTGQNVSNGAASINPEAQNDGGTTTSVIKPVRGSLLEAKRQCKSCRMPIKNAVGGNPPRRCNSIELSALGVSLSVQNVTSFSAENFRFFGEFFSNCGRSVCVGDGCMLNPSSGSAGSVELWEAFRSSPGVDIKLISYNWFMNHFKHLVVKLASMEVSYPHSLAGRCLTPDWLMLQMKYRYDREIDAAERSVLHKICEHDDLPSRRMILYISKCYSNNANKTETTAGHMMVESSINTSRSVLQPGKDVKETSCESPSVELSDGWYSLPCVLDGPLKHMLKRGTITVGTKLMVYGAELLGLSSPGHPLEIPASCHLKISANSTRRARWFAKLGYQPTPRPFPVPLESVFSDGGLVGCVDVVIARVYPMVYWEKKDDSKGVMRCERLKKKEEACHERKREKAIEDICSRVQKDFENEIAQQDCVPSFRRRRSRRLNTHQIKQLQDGEAIYNALADSADPHSIQETLSPEQLAYLESYKLSMTSQRQSELQQRIKAAIQDEENQIPAKRNVTPLLRVKVVPTGGSPGGSKLDCQLSIWQPDPGLQQLIKEGASIRLINVIANQTRYKSLMLHLKATRSTCFETLSTKHLNSLHYHPRKCIEISDLCSSEIPYREFDTVGLVVHLHKSHVISRDLEGPGQVLEMVCLADSKKGILVVKVWGGLKSYGLEDVVSVGVPLCLSNLGYRGLGPNHPWPTASLEDNAVVSENPKDKLLETALAQLKQKSPANTSHHLKTLAGEIAAYL